MSDANNIIKIKLLTIKNTYNEALINNDATIYRNELTKYGLIQTTNATNDHNIIKELIIDINRLYQTEKEWFCKNIPDIIEALSRIQTMDFGFDPNNRYSDFYNIQFKNNISWPGLILEKLTNLLDTCFKVDTKSTISKPHCIYGEFCRRKNPRHFIEEYHPDKRSNQERRKRKYRPYTPYGGRKTKKRKTKKRKTKKTKKRKTKKY